MMKRPIGIMQGRLLPPFEGRFQAFPAHRWDEEFALARDVGLQCIEWIYEVPHEADNPLGTDEGLAKIHALTASTGVAVRSICADYYMERKLVTDGRVCADAVAHLKWLIVRASRLGAAHIVLPFVDQSSLNGELDQRALHTALSELVPVAGHHAVELHLETDLPPAAFVDLLGTIDHRCVRANYDTGNSAALGYDPAVELTALRPWLGSVHIKDRVRGGGTVALGTGDTDFRTCLKQLTTAGYARPYILQAARDTVGDETAWCRQNRQFLEARFHDVGDVSELTID